jgi:hypothetical protein
VSGEWSAVVGTGRWTDRSTITTGRESLTGYFDGGHIGGVVVSPQ